MQFLAAYTAFVNRLNAWIGRQTAWLTAALVLVVCLDVGMRLLRESMIAVQELSWHLFALVFLLAAGDTLRRNRHVRVDVFHTRFSPRTRAWIELLGSLLFLLPFCRVVLIAAYPYIAASVYSGETSANPGGLPARYLIKAAIPAGILFLLMQGLARAADALLLLRGHPPGGGGGD